MSLVVMKFGGTSVGSAARMREVASIVASRSGEQRLVVVSAMAGVTNQLFEIADLAKRHETSRAREILQLMEDRHVATARELGLDTPEVLSTLRGILEGIERRVQGIDLLGELSARTMDEIASSGERMSSVLVAGLLGCPLLDARTVVRTDNHFGAARPRYQAIRKLAEQLLMPLLETSEIVVTQGYIGSDEAGDTTTLGRGGSDFSAGIFGAALQAREIEIWTDVEGIMTADPRIVSNARTVDVLSYEEVAELASYGAKVLHPATVRPAVEAGIPVTIRNTMKPDGNFTTISPGASSGRPCAALAMRRNVAILSVVQEAMTDQSGFLARLFEVFGRRGVSVDLVSTSEVCVSVSLDSSAPLDALVEDLHRLGRVSVASNRAVIAVVGDSLRQTPAVLRTAFSAIDGVCVDLISMGANAINLSFIVQEQAAEEVMRRLHAAFFEAA
ncbi:MAG: lysine-sensitive aspartokinase 3 [Spirochaetaceae bacterium]|nr:lysine-sensitive aspartokinase 3 [Spirochaetaceae bacterium]